MISGGRFRYSDLKEAALFAADAMGFQSEVVGKKSSCVVTPNRSRYKYAVGPMIASS
jgi:hypothetical protein